MEKNCESVLLQERLFLYVTFSRIGAIRLQSDEIDIFGSLMNNDHEMK